MRVRLSSPLSDVKPSYDAVVIGSGYGGSIAASRLSRAGKKVCLLERGREWQPGEYPDTGAEMLAQIQIDTPEGHVGKGTGLYDLRLNKDICVFQGCGLGGTSLVNANVSIKPEPRVFADEKWPAGLRADVNGKLEMAYARASEMLRPKPYPQAWKPLPKMGALEKSASAMGAKFERTNINVNFDVSGPNHVGVEQQPCNNCGDCVSGCNHGAKNTVLMNYLPDAKNFGAEIFCECSVKTVERDGKRWRVTFQPLEMGREKFDAPPLFVTADIVVLAAGTLGSTEILLRSKAAGLPLSMMLGRRFTGNGDVLGFTYNADERIEGIGFGHRSPAVEKDRAPVGPCITGVIDLRNQPALDDGMIIEEGSIPGAMAGFLPGVFSAAAKVFGKNTKPTFGHEIAEDAREAESLLGGPYVGAVNHTQTYLVMTHDDGAGQMSLQNDRLRINWPGVGGEGIFSRVNQNLLRATEPLDGTFVKNPISDKLAGQDLITVHPLGGCVMGEDAARGVVDHKCRVFAGTTGSDVHEGLYVCDGSVIPRPLGVNPLLTISAVSERALSCLAEDRGWKIDYALPSKPGPAPAPRKLAIEFTERMVGAFSVKEKGPATNDDGTVPLEVFQRSASQGKIDGTECEFTLTVRNDDLEALIKDNATPSPFAGTVICSALSAKPILVTKGTFILLMPDPARVETRRMVYEMTLTTEEGKRFHFYGFKVVHNDQYGLDLWPDTSTLYVTIRESDAAGAIVGRGILRILPSDFLKQITTMNVMNAPTPLARFEALVRFGRSFAGTLWDVYGGILKPLASIQPDAAPRKKRELRAPAPEVHRFKTGDGVVLQLERYKGGMKGPVVLTHGLGVSGRIFTLDTVETNLVEFLCARGYDVWNLENRASIDLPSSQTEFTLDQVAEQDYPAAIRTILAETKASSVQVVAHCFGGTTMAMSLLHGLKGVRSVVFSQVAAHADVPFSTEAKSGLHVPDVLDKLGVKSLTAYSSQNESWVDKLFDEALRLAPVKAGERCDNAVCHRISFLYGLLYDHAQLNAATHSTLHELFGIANVRAFEQLAQIVRSHHVVTATGAETYLRFPERMKLPIAFISGADNACYLPSSTQKTFDWLSDANGSLYTRHVVPGYGHIDCIVGKDASRDVFPLIAQHLDATQSESVTSDRVARVKPLPKSNDRSLPSRAPMPARPPAAMPRQAPPPIVWLYRLAAISNFLVTLPAFFAYDWYVAQFETALPNYPFTFWIWSGMAFLWGVMFWEISRDVFAKAAMLKYTWLEKCVTTTCVSIAFFTHNVPASFMAGVVLTDLIWIPMFMLAQRKVRQLQSGEATQASAAVVA